MISREKKHLNLNIPTSCTQYAQHARNFSTNGQLKPCSRPNSFSFEKKHPSEKREELSSHSKPWLFDVIWFICTYICIYRMKYYPVISKDYFISHELRIPCWPTYFMLFGQKFLWDEILPSYKSGDSWMYPYQRTPMGNPYRSPIYPYIVGVYGLLSPRIPI